MAKRVVSIKTILKMSKASAGKQKSEAHKLAISKSKQGSKHPKSKLTEAQVVSIKHLFSSNQMTQKELAAMFKVNASTISSIVVGKSWTHVQLGDFAVPDFEIHEVIERSGI